MSLLVGRFTRALCVLEDSSEQCILYRPQCGDRQGDPPAAQRYIRGQDKLIRPWARRTVGASERWHLEVWDSWRECWVCPVHSLYADDMARIGLCDSAREASRKAKGWRETLAMYTEPHGVIQSDGKLQILADMLPDTVRERAELLDRLGDPLKQRVVCSALLDIWGVFMRCKVKQDCKWNNDCRKQQTLGMHFSIFGMTRVWHYNGGVKFSGPLFFVPQSMASKSHVSPSRC